MDGWLLVRAAPGRRVARCFQRSVPAAVLPLLLASCAAHSGSPASAARAGTPVRSPSGQIAAPSPTHSPHSPDSLRSLPTSVPPSSTPTASSRTASAPPAATGAPATPPPAAAQRPVPAVPAPAAVPLRGRIVVIDPGHDGGNASHPSEINALVDVLTERKACDTVGASTNAGYPEHAFTWSVAHQVGALLTAAGATVVYTRPSDTGVGPCVTQRAAIGNAARANVAISIHADGGPASGRGFHVIEPALIPGHTDAIVAPSDRFARLLRATYAAESGVPVANYLAGGTGLDRRSDLGGLNLSTVPKVFLECANMRNALDAALLTSSAGQARMARAIADGIARYLTSS